METAHLRSAVVFSLREVVTSAVNTTEARAMKTSCWGTAGSREMAVHAVPNNHCGRTSFDEGKVAGGSAAEDST
jgi:hypothetical protein